jgi:hypothetical protein
MKAYYAIQIIGNGAKQRYVIKDVWKEGKGSYTMIPVKGGRPFRSLEGAKRAAAEMQIEIEAIGDLYAIMI